MATAAKRLKKARKIRRHTASEFQRLRNGSLSLRDVLESPEELFLRHCDIWDVLRRAPHLGPAGAKKILISAEIWPHTRIENLSRWELDQILSYLPPRAR
jgi:hypothetical protein